MTDIRLYDVVFSGELFAGTEPAEAKRRLAALFKSDAAAIERLFSGQPIVIRKGVDESTATRYREAMRQVGAVCEITAAKPEGEAAAPALRQPSAGSLAGAAILPAGTPFPQSPAAEPPRYNLEKFTLAELGADLMTPVPVAARVIPDISGITLAPIGSSLTD